MVMLCPTSKATDDYDRYPKKRENRIGPKHKKTKKKKKKQNQRERSRLEREKSKEALLEWKNKNTGTVHQPPMEG